MLEVSSIIAIGYGLYSVVKFEVPKSISEAWSISCQDLTTALLCSLVAFLLDSFVTTKL